MQVNFEKKAAKAGHEAEAALSRTPQGIFEETQHPNFSRTRLIWGVLIATIYLVSVLIGMGDLGSGLSSDTVWYLQLSPYRQPMYGLWANAIYALSGSWHTVQVLQIAAFLSCSAWVIVELAVISGLGMLSAVLFAAMQFRTWRRELTEPRHPELAHCVAQFSLKIPARSRRCRAGPEVSRDCAFVGVSCDPHGRKPGSK